LLTALYSEFKSSIKSPDTEEKLDLVLYRPLGFVIAKISHLLFLTPSMLSIFGLVAGFSAAYYYLHPQNTMGLVIGSLYFILSGIFDSADGQLARISNQSTKLGLILDGICDSIVMIAIYISCALPFIDSYGVVFSIVVFVALYLHSFQCAILDFYHREYLYFGYGKTQDDTYWNPSIDDGQSLIENSLTKTERMMNSLRLSWVKKQQMLTTRTDSERQAMREHILNCSPEEKEFFMQTYRNHNLGLLPFWRLIGPNAHTFVIILFMFLGRFDMFIILFDLLVFNVIIFAVGMMQKRADQAMFIELEL
jgi:hypothetical protein